MLIYYFRPFTIGLFTIFVRLLLDCLTLLVCLPNLIISNFCTTSETDVRHWRFVFTYCVRSLEVCLLLLSVRYGFLCMFSPWVNLIWLFCGFVPIAKRISLAVALFIYCVRSLEVCLLLLSVRYGFVYMFTPCVNLIWLFCVFVPIAKRTSVAVILFTCCVHSLVVCLLLLSVRYGFVYMFTPCVNLMWLFCVFVPIAKRTSVAVILFTCCVHSLVVCLLLLSVRYGFVYMFTPCVNLMWLFCVFVPIAKRTSVAVILFTCCVHSLVVCLLLLSVRYGFVYMFTPCVNLMWLFCVFVPIAKRTSVAVILFTCCVHSLVVCLLLLSVRYGFVYMFTPCVNLMWLFCVFVPIAKK